MHNMKFDWPLDFDMRKALAIFFYLLCFLVKMNYNTRKKNCFDHVTLIKVKGQICTCQKSFADL